MIKLISGTLGGDIERQKWEFYILEIKELPNKELVERYKEERKRYQTMQFQNAVSPIDQPHKLRESRREIARLMMELNLRRKASQEATAEKQNKES